MRKRIVVYAIGLSLFLLTACSTNTNENADINVANSSEPSTFKNTIEHYCEVSGCNKEGIKSVVGLDGSLEYYCVAHYDEMEDIVEKMEEDVYGSSTTFTNKYGTSTTKCVHSGCDNYIASSGDTNCCTTHSRNCGGCGCYIDEDAMFCITCLEKAIQ